MLDGFRDWFRRHLNVVLSFVIGMSFGISILVLAYFSKRNNAISHVLSYGVMVTGHADLGEDLVWLFCGIVIGATAICYAWWRDTTTSGAGLEKEDVLNRLFLEDRYMRAGEEKTLGNDSEK